MKYAVLFQQHLGWTFTTDCTYCSIVPVAVKFVSAHLFAVFWQFPFAKNLQTQTVSTEKLRKTVS